MKEYLSILFISAKDIAARLDAELNQYSYKGFRLHTFQPTGTEEYLAILERDTTVEELGPYSVRHNEVHAAWSIYGPYNLSAVNYFYGERYPYTEESAKAAAEAERNRLNAEYRKSNS